jgi:Glycosyltransferase family 92
MRLFKKHIRFTKQFGIASPPPHPGRYGVAIATMLRNEEDYVDEWLAFHQAVGVRHFIIYDNGSTDRTGGIIKARLSGDELTFVQWAGRMTDAGSGKPLNSQVMAFVHAISNFGPAFRWMAFIDVDEFLLPKRGHTVEEALTAVHGFPNVSLPWHMFGPGGHKVRPKNGLLRNYVYRGRNPIRRNNDATNFKCIVDPCEVTEVGVHIFRTRQHGELTCNDKGQVSSRRGRKRPAFYSSENLQLNHYYTKSIEEFEQKIQRGPASPGTRDRYESRVRSVLNSIEVDVVEDRQIIEFLDRNNIQL